MSRNRISKLSTHRPRLGSQLRCPARALPHPVSSVSQAQAKREADIKAIASKQKSKAKTRVPHPQVGLRSG